MKLFRKDSDYAVRTLIYLAQHAKDGFISSTTVSQELDIPCTFLRRIFSKLIKAGYLSASEGVQGGVRIVQKPSKISIHEIMELFQGPLELSDCMIRKKPCPNRKCCPLRFRIGKIEQLVDHEFRKITIQSLMDDAKP